MEPHNQTNLKSNLHRINWRDWLPSRGNVVFTLVIMTALFWAQSVNALPWSAPKALTTSSGTWPYQGRLADSAGNPITDTVPMIFRLYNSADGAAVPLWEEQWTGPNSVQVSDGLFNVMLGSVTPISQSIVTDNGNLWLGITAGTDDEMTPRIQLGSMPFAVQALTVPDASITTEKIADGAVTQSKLGADVSLVPPDGSITSAKLADGSVTSTKVADGSLTSRHVNLTNGQIQPSDPTFNLPVNTHGGVPGLNTTVTPATNQTYFFYLVVEFYNASAPSGFGQASLYVDGVRVGTHNAVMHWDAKIASVAQVYIVDLTPGSHVVEVRASSDVAGGQIWKNHTTLSWFSVSQ